MSVDTNLGRFLSPDPIGYGDGPNMYAYVRNDPSNRVDETGMWGGPRTGDTGRFLSLPIGDMPGRIEIDGREFDFRYDSKTNKIVLENGIMINAGNAGPLLKPKPVEVDYPPLPPCNIGSGQLCQNEDGTPTIDIPQISSPTNAVSVDG
ncbi:MAG: hypothetical protein HWD60_02630 [Defluviicoccus sp.]|nr:MAG: hypothetical protein HWD60_02630 [Defluviicoccus sp.]